MSVLRERSQELGILIVCDNGHVSQNLRMTLLDAGLQATCVASMEAGCASASTGQFQLVVTTQALFDGTWRRLTEMASRHRLGFMVIVVANKFDVDYYSEALTEGVFEVLDAASELTSLPEVARCALWAAYLEGAGPLPEVHSLASDVTRRHSEYQLPWRAAQHCRKP
jgi:DNA-binding NtrC family response regulator